MRAKKIIKKYEEVWSKMRDLIRSINKHSDDYDEKHIKIKFVLDDDSSLNKKIGIHDMWIIAGAVFHENSKCYTQVFLDECLYKL